MVQPYPLPRTTRESGILVGNGGATYGPFQFRIFDTVDVKAYVRPQGQKFFEPAAISVSKVNGTPFDDFTVTFAQTLPATTQFYVVSERLHERDTAITRAGTISAQMLEKELSEQATILQELSRDVARAWRRAPNDPGGHIEPLNEGHFWIADGDGNMVDGGDAGEIGKAQQYAEAALDNRIRAEVARLLAQAAAASVIAGSKNVKGYGAKVDGDADDTGAINDAVQNALFENHVLYLDGDARVTGNIPNLHDVRWEGPGRIVRDGYAWHVAPAKEQQNIIYVGGANLNVNDGVTPDRPTNISTAINRLRNIGDKGLDGRWRIEILEGTLTSNGVTLENLPVFRNRLEIWGADVALTATPTTIWDGTAATRGFAIRGDWSNNLTAVFLHFKNIKFTNWNNSNLAGAIVIWASGDVLTENIHTDNCAIGDWYRQCYARVTHGRRDNAQTYGVSIQYGASGNVGNLSGGGVTMTNCGECVSVGRNSTVYIQGSDLSGGVLISVTRNSRIRTQANTYRAWTNCVVFAQAVGVWTPDNGQGFPDSYLQTPSSSAPVFRCQSGSVHTLIHREGYSLHTYNISGSIATISGASGVLTQLGTAPGVVGGDFVPARVPAWWAYSPTASLEVEVLVVLSPNAGGTFGLYGAGAGAGQLLAQITIPADAAGRTGVLKIKIAPRPGVSSWRYTAQFISGANSLFAAGTTANMNNANIRAASELPLNYRLYWTPSDNNQAQFADMRSYIDA